MDASIKEKLSMWYEAIRFKKRKRTKRSVADRPYDHYQHYMEKDLLVGLSGNANDMMRFVQKNLACKTKKEDVSYFVETNAKWRNDFNIYLQRHGVKPLSNPTITRTIAELVKRKILLPFKKGLYVYNFVDFMHIGDREQFEKDKEFFHIYDLLNETEQNY